MYIKVKVFPKSKKEMLKQTGPNRFEIKVKEKAERNLANNKVLEIMAEYLNVNKKEVKIISGHHHSSKLLKIDDVLKN
ncbi:MAG: DUF167 domain-containing protein [Candidatus Pacebacteria bacterium]|nr:DUF167 domain-containing protein [Candidatus Paceibacterota bacterium]